MARNLFLGDLPQHCHISLHPGIILHPATGEAISGALPAPMQIDFSAEPRLQSDTNPEILGQNFWGPSGLQLSSVFEYENLKGGG